MQHNIHFSTRALKSVRPALKNAHPVSAPIYLSTTYERAEDGSYYDGLIYSRNDNPNRHILEKSVAQLENGALAYAFGSGMAAIHAVFQALESGDEVLLPEDVYYNVRLLFQSVFERWGLKMQTADFTSISAIEAAIHPETKLIWMETPSNPQLQITDIRAVVELAETKGILTAVDNTWATPVLQRPLDLGADISMHSSTKYFGGHSDVLSGLLVLKSENELAERIHRIQKLSGGVPSPFDCWLVARGIQTLHLRVKAQSATAMKLSTFLHHHPQIEQVNYPGLPSHPQHDIAKRQMQGGFGGMLSVLTKGDAMNISNRLQHFTSATSLGGVESLVEHRRSVEGEGSATPENLLRLSIGLEAVEDLIADWEQALMNIE
ncbi:MAG: PLP-dependent aspartate aminotransferase family protein [Bacteroidota bacterium]